MQTENAGHDDALMDGLLRESFDPKPRLDQSFNETVLSRHEKTEAARRMGPAWGGWLMSFWWGSTVALVYYLLSDLSEFGSGVVSLPVLIVLGTVMLCGGCLFVALRRCGFRISDTLLSSLEWS